MYCESALRKVAFHGMSAMTSLESGFGLSEQLLDLVPGPQIRFRSKNSL